MSRHTKDAIDELAKASKRGRQKTNAERPLLIEHRLWDDVPQSVRECWDVGPEERSAWYQFDWQAAAAVLPTDGPSSLWVHLRLQEIVERTVTISRWSPHRPPYSTRISSARAAIRTLKAELKATSGIDWSPADLSADDCLGDTEFDGLDPAALVLWGAIGRLEKIIEEEGGRRAASRGRPSKVPFYVGCYEIAQVLERAGVPMWRENKDRHPEIVRRVYEAVMHMPRDVLPALGANPLDVISRSISKGEVTVKKAIKPARKR